VMEELRDLLGMLNSAADAGTVEPVARHGLDAVESLLERTRLSGVSVKLHRTGRPGRTRAASFSRNQLQNPRSGSKPRRELAVRYARQATTDVVAPRVSSPCRTPKDTAPLRRRRDQFRELRHNNGCRGWAGALAFKTELA
jgi:hypothetical protein